MDFDFELFKSVTQTATGIASAIRETAEAATRLKGLTKATEGRSEAEIEAAVAQVVAAVENAGLQNKLLEAQVTVLSDAIRKANEAQAKLDRYQLWETQSGYLVYRLKEADRGDYPPHFICPCCYGDGQHSILQGGRWQKACKTCKALFFFDPRPEETGSEVATF